MDLSSRVVASPEHLSARLGPESVVLGVTKGVYYGLDEVGAHVWDLIQTPAVVADVRDAIVSDFDVDAGTCERDLVAFLLELDSNGMIDVVDERQA